jgi:hypothetical protein
MSPLSWLDAMVRYDENPTALDASDRNAEAVGEEICPTVSVSAYLTGGGPSSVVDTEGDTPDGTSGFTEAISHDAVSMVDGVRQQALELGWSEAQLYRDHGRYAFPCGQDYGLVCFLRSGDQVGEITRRSIEIVGSGGRKLRFYNSQAEQPWLRRAA